MHRWLWRAWRRFRDESPGRAVRAARSEATAGTLGRCASAVYARRSTPTPIWERDWDVCCLVDGCRVDLLEEVAAASQYDYLPTTADIDTIWSVGSQSAEWMVRTFAAEHADEMARTAYVTGNPFTAQAGEGIEAVETDPIPLSSSDFGLLYEAWREEWLDGEISTIPPGPLTDAAIAIWRARDRLDVDRVLVHYMQPHAPFRSRPDWFLGDANPNAWGRIDEDDPAEFEDLTAADLDEETRELLEAFDTGVDVGRDPWTRVRDGELPAEAFWAAYRDNLEWVLSDVARLVGNCDGRLVLSSDHGNAAGEFGVWSHPPGVHLPALREVPWVTIEGVDRGTETPSVPAGAVADRSGADAVATDRLADLGYR